MRTKNGKKKETAEKDLEVGSTFCFTLPNGGKGWPVQKMNINTRPQIDVSKLLG